MVNKQTKSLEDEVLDMKFYLVKPSKPDEDMDGLKYLLTFGAGLIFGMGTCGTTLSVLDKLNLIDYSKLSEEGRGMAIIASILIPAILGPVYISVKSILALSPWIDAPKTTRDLILYCKKRKINELGVTPLKIEQFSIDGPVFYKLKYSGKANRKIREIMTIKTDYHNDTFIELQRKLIEREGIIYRLKGEYIVVRPAKIEHNVKHKISNNHNKSGHAGGKRSDFHYYDTARDIMHRGSITGCD